MTVCHDITVCCGITLWASLLGRYSEQHEVVVGITYPNREQPGTEELVGYLMNTLALRVSLDWTATVSGAVEATNMVVSNAISNACVPFVKVVEAVNPVRDASRNPIFQTMFTWHEANEQGTEQFLYLERVVDSRVVRIPHNMSKYELALGSPVAT